MLFLAGRGNRTKVGNGIFIIFILIMVTHMIFRPKIFSFFIIFILTLSSSLADPPIVTVKKGDQQGRAIEFNQFEPFVAEYSGFGTGGNDNQLSVGITQDNTFLWSREYKGSIESKYAVEYGLLRPLPPGSYKLTWYDKKRKEAGYRDIKINELPPPNSNTSWTVFIYGHGDSNLTLNLLEDINEMITAGGSDNFKIVLLADFDSTSTEALKDSELPREYWDKVIRIVIDKDGPNVVEVLPEKDLDDPKELEEFLDWGMSNSDSDRYGLVLWDHGGQWEGFGQDTSDGKGWARGVSMWTSDIKDVISESLKNNNVKKFDFISFDTCLMGGAEQLVDFHELCDLYIANPEIDYGDGWDYASTMAFLRSQPDISMIEFAKVEADFWNFHHQQAADRGFKVHVSYDMNLFPAYNAKLKAFTGELVRAVQNNAVDMSSMAKLRRESLPYSLASPRVGQSTITDYIDLGNFAFELSRIAPEPLGSVSLDLVDAINELIIAKSLGTERQHAIGLSIYYPIDGKYSQLYSRDETWTINGKSHRIRQNFLQESYGGDNWKKYLSAVQGLNIGDVAPPKIETPEPTAIPGLPEESIPEEVEDNDAILASTNSPAVMNFEVLEGDDAYSARAALVIDETFDNQEQYIFLGEIDSGILDGIGKYELEWDARMPMISLTDSEVQEPVFLGGYAWEPGSNIHISFADYLAPGAEEVVPLILFTEFDEFGYGIVDTVLEDTIDTDGLEEYALSPREYTRGFEPGGTIWPVYYTETLQDGEYVSDFSSFEEVAIVIPETGTDGLEISDRKVANGTYGVALQTYDYFENESDLITFLVNVTKDQPVDTFTLPEIKIIREDQEMVVSWSSDSDVYILQVSNNLVSSQWQSVDKNELDVADGQFILRHGIEDRALFYRLVRPVPIR